MNTSIVGYTGFVGSNLCCSFNFDGKFNSKNIKDAFNSKPDLLVYAGVPAEMFLANKYPFQDELIIRNAIENIKKINPAKVVLISSIAVYDQTYNVDENSIIDEFKSSNYGRNRRILEKWIEENFNDYLIVRLPGLYGINLKKNFIYDMIHLIPGMLNEEKFKELSFKESLLLKYYQLQSNGFYKCKSMINKKEIKILQECFTNLNFTALNFTDSRGIYQYYNLNQLWKHLTIALSNKIKLLNIATEPVTPAEIYKYVTGEDFLNEINKPVPHFDFKTKYASIFSGNNGYILTKEQELSDIKKFVNNYIK